jgi:ABC-type lipoprotein release transport system permease subunit
MIGVVVAWLRLDVRRRLRSLLVLSLLVALAAGTVMTAVAGARRGASAVDRLLDQTLPATAMVLPNQAGFDWAAVRALPEVEALATFVLSAEYVIEELPDDFFGASFPFADDEAMRTVERPVVLEGRMLDPARADEVLISPAFRETFGLGVGDSLTIRLHSAETVDAAARGGELPAEPDGPAVEARIVGIVRTPMFHDEAGNFEGGLVPSPGLFTQYEPNLAGTTGSAVFNAVVRLRGGESDLATFKADLERISGRTDIDIMNVAESARHDREVTAFEANALLMFAVAAGVAATFLVGQSVVRYAAATVADLQVLRAVGMAPGQLGWAAAAGPTVAALAGAALGVAGAVLASRWFPIGTASRLEPAPGFDADWTVLVLGGVGTPVLVAMAAAGAAWVALRSTAHPVRPNRSAITAAAVRAGAPVPAIVGARFALEPGRGRQAVPVRPALFGSILGVLGVVAAFTFSAGVNDASAHPERFGQSHQLIAFVGMDGEYFGPVDELRPVLANDPDVAAVNDARIAVGEVSHVPVTLFTLDASWEPVITEGRAPEGPAEVALGPASAQAMGVTVGDVIPMTGTAGVRELTVTGLAFVPEAPHNDYVTGGWVSAAGYDQLFDPDSEVSPAFKFRIVFIALDPGAEPGVVAGRLTEAVGIPDLIYHPEEPSPIAELRQLRTLPVFLGAFLSVLALGAVGHALATAVRKRRHDVAVLRAVGLTRTQSRAVVLTQATVLALIGLVVGIPLGVALGRTVWRYVADTTPLFYVPPAALLAVLLAIPVALLAANGLAAWPGHRAASLRVGHVLRAE